MWRLPRFHIFHFPLTQGEPDYAQVHSLPDRYRSHPFRRSHIGSLLIIQFVFGVVGTVGSETALSFLGLGVKLPDVSLGTLLQGGTAAVQSSPWLFYFPAATLTLLTVSMAFIGDGLRDALDPNSNSGGKA